MAATFVYVQSTGLSDEGGQYEASEEAGQLRFDSRGGPGTFRGTDYQLRVAVFECLDLLSRQIRAPHLDFVLALEGALIGDEGVENWDVVVAPGARVYEAKVKPTAEDVRNFFGKVQASEAEAVTLVYGEAGGATFKALESLLRLAEATSDSATFERLAQGASTEVKQLAGGAGEKLYPAVKRMRMINYPAQALGHDCEARAEYLAEGAGKRLVEHLIELFSGNAGRRRPHRMRGLLGDLRKMGIEVRPGQRDDYDLSVQARLALRVLWQVPPGAPPGVLASAIGIDEVELEQVLKPLLEARVIRREEAYLVAESPLGNVEQVDDPELCAAFLARLLSWISENRTRPELDRAIDTAMALLEPSVSARPEVVAVAFRVLDKHLKKRGKKRLVLDVANRSIEAAQRSPRGNDDVVEAEAVALICGRAWVYQRVGQLKSARADSESSLKLAEQIGSERSRAFCHKCLGRLSRLEAERGPIEGRKELLRQSIEHLEEAIRLFSHLNEDGEVGDSHSLLGRTHYVALSFEEAKAEARKAGEFLTPRNGKDYLDLQLLLADLAATEERFNEAEAIYSAVLDDAGKDEISSEIYARARRQRGIARVRARKNRQAGCLDLLAAAEIFSDLGEPDNAGECELMAIRVRGRFPRENRVAELLSKEEPLVQAIALNLHNEAVQDMDKRVAVAFRREEPIQYWPGLIKDAQRQAARRRRDWS